MSGGAEKAAARFTAHSSESLAPTSNRTKIVLYRKLPDCNEEEEEGNKRGLTTELPFPFFSPFLSFRDLYWAIGGRMGGSCSKHTQQEEREEDCEQKIVGGS